MHLLGHICVSSKHGIWKWCGSLSNLSRGLYIGESCCIWIRFPILNHVFFWHFLKEGSTFSENYIWNWTKKDNRFTFHVSLKRKSLFCLCSNCLPLQPASTILWCCGVETQLLDIPAISSDQLTEVDIRCRNLLHLAAPSPSPRTFNLLN